MIKYKISLKKTTEKGNVSRDVSFISDGKMVTRHNNPADTFKIWKEKHRKGEAVTYKKGILMEAFVDKTAEEIRDHVVKELEILRDKMGKKMEIIWLVDKC
ncbi:MAG: hypothetical protein B6229_00345 [Spirochaetaceae bacterium 4572_7]|nr:MAG: hypothetical protein B6229_00345 [Spirochaetaceae bacterium 4572_7]